MLPPHPQMYRKNIIQAIKMRPSALFLFCRGEPTGTLMRDYCSDTCRPLQRTLARTAPEPCRPICVPSRVRLRCLLTYLRTSRVRLRCLLTYLRTLARTVRTLPPLAAYLYTSFYASYLSFLCTFLIIYLHLLYKSFKGFI